MTDMAYIYSHDGDEHGVKFGIQLCNDDTVRETVCRHLYPDGPDDAFEGIMSQLREGGSYDFEDGWVVLKVGVPAIVEFMTYQLREAKAEERHADEQRFKELQRRQTAETKYSALCEALIGAIDTNAPAIREIAANGGIAVHG